MPLTDKQQEAINKALTSEAPDCEEFERIYRRYRFDYAPKPDKLPGRCPGCGRCNSCGR